MKKLLALGGIALLLTAGLSLFGQERPYSQIMKEIAGANGQVKKALDAGTPKEDVVSGGQKLVALFKEVEEFWTKRGGAADAVEAAQRAQAAAKELANPVSIADAKAAQGKLNDTCKGCHAAHREKTEGGFRIK